MKTATKQETRLYEEIYQSVRGLRSLGLVANNYSASSIAGQIKRAHKSGVGSGAYIETLKIGVALVDRALSNEQITAADVKKLTGSNMSRLNSLGPYGCGVVIHATYNGRQSRFTYMLASTELGKKYIDRASRLKAKLESLDGLRDA